MRSLRECGDTRRAELEAPRCFPAKPLAGLPLPARASTGCPRAAQPSLARQGFVHKQRGDLPPRDRGGAVVHACAFPTTAARSPPSLGPVGVDARMHRPPDEAVPFPTICAHLWSSADKTIFPPGGATKKPPREAPIGSQSAWNMVYCDVMHFPGDGRDLFWPVTGSIRGFGPSRPMSRGERIASGLCEGARRDPPFPASHGRSASGSVRGS